MKFMGFSTVNDEESKCRRLVKFTITEATSKKKIVRRIIYDITMSISDQLNDE